jgi:hypothetical protein
MGHYVVEPGKRPVRVESGEEASPGWEIDP